MTGQFEQDTKRACATFIAEIERALIVAIHAAFTQVSTHAIEAMAAPRGKAPALDPLLPRGAPVPASHRAPAPRSTGLAAPREQMIACVRDNPGATTTRLGRLLGVHPAKLRRQLQQLEAEGVLRSEERRSGFGGRQCRAYFPGEREVAHITHVIEHNNGAPSPAPSTTVGAGS